MSANYIYVISVFDGQYIKVGVADRCVESRVLTLQCGCPGKLRIEAIFYSPSARRIEAEVHRKLKHYKTDGGKEWFDCDAEDAVALLRTRCVPAYWPTAHEVAPWERTLYVDHLRSRYSHLVDVA